MKKKTKWESRFYLLLFLSNGKEGRKARERGWAGGQINEDATEQ